MPRITIVAAATSPDIIAAGIAAGVAASADVLKIELVTGRNVAREISVPLDGLPRLDLVQSMIRAERLDAGRAV